MATALQLRRGTTAQHASFTGAAGEVTVDTDKNTVVVHDGSTAGGYALAVEQGAISSVSWDSSLDTYPTVAEFPSGPCAIHDKVRRCILNDSGAVVYYLDGLDSTKREAGGTAALDGTAGQVMVEIPKFFVKMTKVGNLNTWWISDKKQAGFSVHPAFVKNGTEVAARYVSAYDACAFDGSSVIVTDNADNQSARVNTATDKLISVSGQYPMAGLTRNEFRLLAANRGTGWRQLDFYLMSAIQLLYLVEYRTFNSQFAISDGNTRHTTWTAGGTFATNNRTCVSGLSNALGNRSGGSATGTINSSNNGDYVSYRGIENWFGNVWNWVDGINIGPGGNYKWWVSNTDTQFADNTSTNYTEIGTAASSDGFITNVLDIATAFIPSAVAGSSTTGLADQYFRATGNRVLAVGGSASNGAAAGGFCLSALADSSLRVRNFGARLAF